MNRIRITGPGIYGANGEYPIGHEFDTAADLPAGWKGRAEIVGKGAPSGASLVVNPAPEAATADEIASAIALLDKANNDHWTEAALPRVEAVAEITGKTVTRKAIEEAAPDAKRPE